MVNNEELLETKKEEKKRKKKEKKSKKEIKDKEKKQKRENKIKDIYKSYGINKFSESTANIKENIPVYKEKEENNEI